MVLRMALFVEQKVGLIGQTLMTLNVLSIYMYDVKAGFQLNFDCIVFSTILKEQSLGHMTLTTISMKRAKVI